MEWIVTVALLTLPFVLLAAVFLLGLVFALSDGGVTVRWMAMTSGTVDVETKDEQRRQRNELEGKQHAALDAGHSNDGAFHRPRSGVLVLANRD